MRSGGKRSETDPQGHDDEEAQRKQEARMERMGDIPFGRMLRCRVRYFTAGAVIGSRAFVNEVFEGARERFGAKRKDGARRLRGNGARQRECCGVLETCTREPGKISHHDG